jgi:glycosyltransferase involved in cell wall biosynthesis
MPLDILIPFWGDPALLRDTVRSVQAQTSDDWLLTVVDDAYPDPSVGEWFAQLDDPRIRYERNPTNVGITGNFRRCVELATQDRMVVVGCDDLLLPNYVATVLAAHERFPQADMIQPGVQVVGADGAVVTTLTDTVKQRLLRPRARAPRLLGGEALAASLLRGNWLYWPSIAFSRRALATAGFKDDYPVTQDLAVEIDILCAGGTLLLVPTVCFSYRRHDESASSSTAVDGSRFDGERRFFAAAAEQVAALGWHRAARAARLHATSRLHAATLLPRAVLARDTAAVRILVRHACR